jgi:hypothetical protein
MVSPTFQKPCLPLLLLIVALLAVSCSGRTRLPSKAAPPAGSEPEEAPFPRRPLPTMSSRQPCASRWIRPSPATSTNW